jgi:hypothetical protein
MVEDGDDALTIGETNWQSNTSDNVKNRAYNSL